MFEHLLTYLGGPVNHGRAHGGTGSRKPRGAPGGQVVVFLILAGLLVLSTGSASAQGACSTQGVCDPEDPSWPTRPYWGEATNGYPDYETISNNLNSQCSIKLAASLVSKALTALGNSSSQADESQSTGVCICDPIGCAQELVDPLTRDDCTTQCDTINNTNPSCTNGKALWLPTDLFNKKNGDLLFLLKHIEWLDQLKQFLVGKDGTSSDLITALKNIDSGLDNAQELLTKLEKYVDEFTEGYHLGGYSDQRPDLHVCVGYGGHGAFADFPLFGGDVKIGGRYTSHNLSAKHRAQFRSGGFGVTAFKKTLTILPGIEGDIQLNGIRPWSADSPFGLNLGSGGIPLSDVKKYDVFHLVSDPDADGTTKADCLDTDSDGIIKPAELVLKSFYPVNYVSSSDQMTYAWPRDAVTCDWEKKTTTVLSAGSEYELDPSKIHRNITPVLRFGPYFTAQPYLDLSWGIHWISDANGLRKRLLDTINKKLDSSLKLEDSDFGRDRWPFQADDLTADDGVTLSVKPEVGAYLTGGIDLSKFLRMGVTVGVGVGVNVEPGANGGLVDLKLAQIDALVNSNPPKNLPCEAVWEQRKNATCSNSLWPESSKTYACLDQDGTVETDSDGTLDSDGDGTIDADVDGTLQKCEDFGYCTAPDGSVTQDVTKNDCGADSVLSDPDASSGACCLDSDGTSSGGCVDVNSDGSSSAIDHCSSTFFGGSSCSDISSCASTKAFVPYTCAELTRPVVTGWKGPGCHPLTNGFPSACSCETDADCAPGETCSSEKCQSGSASTTCDCDTDADCDTGRQCEQGACIIKCNSTSDCGQYKVCKNGGCVSQFDTPYAEQIAWGMKPANQVSPAYAVSTYALSDLDFSAYLSASINLGATIKIFKKSKTLTLWTYANSWPLASSNKSWYQPGLESQYEGECAPTYGVVTNYQPDPNRVKRYPSSLPSSVYRGNAGTWDSLVNWCKPQLPNDVEDPQEPTNDDVINSLQDTSNWGLDIGSLFWQNQNLCVNGAPVGEWFDPKMLCSSDSGNPWAPCKTDPDCKDGSCLTVPGPEALTCSYDYQGTAHSFPASNLTESLLLIWGCLDKNANSYATLLADHFDGVHDPLNINKQFEGRQVIDLSQILVDPNEEFELSNVKSSIRNYFSAPTTFVGYRWYNLVEACFDSGFATLQPGDLTVGVEGIGPCCGNSVLNAGEECDDGNTVGGDGCSMVCQIEPSCVDDAGPDFCPGTCRVDDNGDGTIDDAGELCPKDARGNPIAYGDDTCCPPTADCVNTPGPDGCPGSCGIDDNRDGTIDNSGEQCPKDPRGNPITYGDDFCCEVSVRRTPGEASGPGHRPLLVTGYDPGTGQVTVSFEPACEADTHVAYSGALPLGGKIVWDGIACGLGASGNAVFDPGAGSRYFVVVGQVGPSPIKGDGPGYPAVEGSYGRDPKGIERPEGTGSCHLTRDLASPCRWSVPPALGDKGRWLPRSR